MTSTALRDGADAASLTDALSHVRALTHARRHREALDACDRLLAAVPGQRDALLLAAVNLRCLGAVPEALQRLGALERGHPRFSLLHQERGHCLAQVGDAAQAVTAYAQAVGLNGALAQSWAMLDQLHRAAGRAQQAADAARQLARLRELPAGIVQAGSLFSDGDLRGAERLLRQHLAQSGRHVEALRLLARIAQQRGADHEAERLFEELLERAPAYRAARLDYARLLLARLRYLPARQQLEVLLQALPADPQCRTLHATACAGLGEHEAAIATYQELLAVMPHRNPLRLLLGRSLQAIGRQSPAIAAYRAATAGPEGVGDAYWSLANLKSYRFADDEIAAMQAAEAAPDTPAPDRCQLCFALGKAFEDRHEFACSWRYYERGNGMKRAAGSYRPEFIEAGTCRQIEVCTPGLFAARAGSGVGDPDPIFVVGLPRSGSTLIEQVLSSHPQVEGTIELFDLPRIVQALQGSGPDPLDPPYPGVLAQMAPGEFARLGRRYLDDTRAFRREPGRRPHFVDKMPNNFRHVGLIHLMLPRAKIVDVRREPMACCFSNLKQLYESGQEFSYGIDDIARYYRSYLQLMRHWDRVLPGRVLRVVYEDVVDDLEGSVRRLLAHCGLDFDARCLAFHRTRRAVATPSSEQVRQPIHREGLQHWRNFEPWLGPLAEALGEERVRYRD